MTLTTEAREQAHQYIGPLALGRSIQQPAVELQ